MGVTRTEHHTRHTTYDRQRSLHAEAPRASPYNGQLDGRRDGFALVLHGQLDGRRDGFALGMRGQLEGRRDGFGLGMRGQRDGRRDGFALGMRGQRDGRRDGFALGMRGQRDAALPSPGTIPVFVCIPELLSDESSDIAINRIKVSAQNVRWG